jgi:polar amino acid transport system substrate-binding protein
MRWSMSTRSTSIPRALLAALLVLAVGQASAAAQDASPSAGEEPDGHLARILEAGRIVMSTDPQYPPQSELLPEGTYQGFDIDVGTEIARRLGIEIAFVTPAWDVITAGSWGGRWDFSVGSMTITTAREEILDFTRPYYFTPAQMTARADLGYQSVDELAGQSVCVGRGTTYLEWFQGTLDLGADVVLPAPPEGSSVTTLSTDRLCAESWAAGRRDFEGWLSSSTTVQQAIEDGLPVVAVGDPIFAEPLAVAFDKGVEDNDSLVAAVDAIVAGMHADGTLSALSQEWFGLDLTQGAGATTGDDASSDAEASPDIQPSPDAASADAAEPDEDADQ